MPSQSILLKNATFTTLHPPRLQLGDVRIAGGKIFQIGTGLKAEPREEVVDLHAKLLLPGFVCAHTHLYSSLARGMPPPAGPPRNFLEILQKIWWRLDQALDEESIYYSGLIGAIEAGQCGTTALVDHHASPNCIDGSLDILQEALEKVGIRGVLCYEVTDRGGPEKRKAGLAENERFLKKQNSELVRGLVGAHASFTLEDETLTACADLAARWNTGIHIHVAEDPCDAEETRSKYGTELFQRLQRFGILQPRSLLAHNIHLTPAELALARESGAWLLHNPRSNMNNRVGHAAVQHFGNRSAIGTDGFPADMLEETRFGYFKAQEDYSGMAPHKMVAMLHRGNALAGEIFHLPFGAPLPGSVADFVVMDYLPPTPMHEENLAAHVLFGMHAAMVESVMVQGKWIFRNRQWLHIDVQQIYEQAEAAANKLWEKMEKY